MESKELVVKCPWCEEYSQMSGEFRDQIVVCPRCGFKFDTRDKGIRIMEKPRGSRNKLPTARLLEKEAENQGESYSNGDIALMILFEGCEEAETLLGDLLGRTRGGVNFAGKWYRKVKAGKVNTLDRGAWNKIRRQFRAVRKKLGRLADPLKGDKKRVTGVGPIITQAMLMRLCGKEIEAARNIQDKLEDRHRRAKRAKKAEAEPVDR